MTNLITKPTSAHWLTIYAKPDKPLHEHSLETAIMAEVLLTESSYRISLDKLYDMTDKSISKEDLLASILFLISIHDLGKLHPIFQEHLFSSRSMLDMITEKFRHEDESADQLKNYLKNAFRETSFRTRAYLERVLKAHHQRRGTTIERQECTSEEYQKDVHDMIAYFSEVYPFTPFTVTGKENAFYQIVSGILRFSDWAASSYYETLSSKNEGYVEDCYEKARDYLKAGGLMGASIDDADYDYKKLLGIENFKPYPLQEKLIDVMKTHPKAECILIEDQPGNGKTEGSFYTAVKLLQNYGHNSIYIALPTDATASEMLPRLEKCFKAHGWFADSDARLLTGKAWLHDDADAKVEWETKARKLFTPLACGTVDQLMQIGMKLKAGDMRLLAVTNKVVIIDEFHAYDAYMMVILKETIEWLKALHVPVVILSATLLNETRKELFSIYSEDEVGCAGYPRITCADGGHIYTYECEAAREHTYQIKTIPHKDAVDMILKSIETGGNTLYIANTVAEAYELYEALREAYDKDTAVNFRLYTARTTPSNKEKMGSEMVYLYGKKGKREGKRPKKTIVVSTQIMEMSVDVDFDTVFSELAPADALFQRMGRMGRHDDKGTVRENGFKSIFYIVIPEKKNKWYLPYAECVLEGAEKVFSKYREIRIPQDIQTLLEDSYKEAGPKWKDAAWEAMAKAAAKVIDSPDASYEPRGDLDVTPCTRDSENKTETIICVPDGEVVSDTKEWTKKAILEWSVTVPEKKISDKISALQDTSKTTWLRSYKLVRNQEAFWGPDGQFVFGL